MRRVFHISLNVLILITFNICYSSCKVEKRLYRPGYHVEWHKAKPTAKAHNPTPKRAVKVPQRLADDKQEIVASLECDDAELLLVPEIAKEFSQARCDTIFLLDGNRFHLVRLIEISDGELTYRPCEAIFGAEETFNIELVSRVVMRNGEILTFDGPVLDSKNCVTLFFRDGRREEVLIENREANALYYSPCYEEGAVRMVYLRDLAQIRDKWGRTEKIEEEAASSSKDPRVAEPTSLVALGTSIISALPILILIGLSNIGTSLLFVQILSVVGVGLSLFSLIAGIMGVVRTGKKPTVYKGLAISAIAIAIALLTGLLNVGMVMAAFS